MDGHAMHVSSDMAAHVRGEEGVKRYGIRRYMAKLAA